MRGTNVSQKKRKRVEEIFGRMNDTSESSARSNSEAKCSSTRSSASA